MWNIFARSWRVNKGGSILKHLLKKLIDREVELGLSSGILHGTILSVEDDFVRFVETALPTYGPPGLIFVNINEIHFVRIIREGLSETD